MRVFGRCTAASSRAALTLLLVVGGPAAGAAQCVEVVPGDEYHCRFHAIDPDNNVVFLDLSDGTIRAANVSRPDDPTAGVVLDPLIQFGWTSGPSSVSPDRERILVGRMRLNCPPYTNGPGPGLDCSYGRPTLWLAQHAVLDPDDPDDDLWVHVNLTRRLLGRNSEIHGWSAWLHRDLALFNAVVFPERDGWYGGPDGYDQAANAAQIYAVRFLDDGAIAIERYAPEQLWRDQCLTGRVVAQPPRELDRCFDGQRVSIVRRCYDEPDLVHGWAWFNTARADGMGGPCRVDSPVVEVPVLRTYVLEVDSNCVPTADFEDLVPVRQPPDGAVYRQMGIIPEWGDMQSAVSSDGRWIAVATNMGDPEGDLEDNCAGFGLNLMDPGNPLSGAALRWTHVCELGPDLSCVGDAVPVGVELHPPESTAFPGFVLVPKAGLSTLVFTREWGTLGEPPGRDVQRLDFHVGPDARHPLAFGANATGIAPIPSLSATDQPAPRRPRGRVSPASQRGP